MNRMSSNTELRELTFAECDSVSGGARNSDNPLVKTFLNAFQGAYDAAVKKTNQQNVELMRNQGCLGPTHTPI